MKKLIATIIALGLGMNAGNVLAQTDDVYVKGSIGYSFENELGSTEPDNDYNFGVGIGKYVTDSFKIEGEYEYFSNDVDMTDNTVLFNNFSLNALYEVATFGGFVPFVGAGMGVGFVTNNEVDNDASMTYKLIGGVDYEFTDSWKFGVHYNYIEAHDNDYQVNNVKGVLTYTF